MSLQFEVREASVLDALVFAGARPFLRKVLTFQARRYPSLVVLREGAAVAFVSFASHPRRRVEFTMLVKPQAQTMMVGLVRLAHLTLSQLAQDGTRFYAHVRETSEVARRMARLVGFRPLRFKDDATIWFFTGGKHERSGRYADRFGGEESRKGAEDAARAAGGFPGAAAFHHGG